ncbi:MAG: lysophospholipid acyltransferase family protein [Sphingomonadaceae bacterium]
MTLLRSLLFALVFYLGSIPLVLLAAGSAIFGQRAIMTMSRLWAQYHYLCVRWLLGIRVVVEGEFPRGNAIIAMKHESMLEAVETLRLIERPAVVFKAELLNIPVWGWVARRHGVIPVAREAGAAALRAMLTAARAAVAASRPIVIFPEGTRVAPGDAPPLRPGIAGLYKAMNLPVVPVAIDSGWLWPRRGLLRRSGVVTMRIGTPIPPGLKRDEIETRIHTAINALNAVESQ